MSIPSQPIEKDTLSSLSSPPTGDKNLEAENEKAIDNKSLEMARLLEERTIQALISQAIDEALDKK